MICKTVKTMGQAEADFRKNFNLLSYRHSPRDVFSSFLDYVLVLLSPTQDFSETLKMLEKTFDEEEHKVFYQMFQDWAIISDNDGEGFHDALGDLFMKCVSFGHNGQFFTPQPLCDMIAGITDGSTPGKSVSDPACGSVRAGRFYKPLKLK